jgi:hypothetical protein
MIRNPFTALEQGADAAASLDLDAFDVELLKAAIFLHPNAHRWVEEEKWDRLSDCNLPPLTDPKQNPFIALEIARRATTQRQNPQNDLAVDRLLDAIDSLWLLLRDHPRVSLWKTGLVAYEREQLRAERAKPGTVAGIDPQFTGGEAA